MTQVSLRIHNVALDIEIGKICNTSDTTKEIFKGRVPEGVTFPEADVGSDIEGLSLQAGLEKLEAMGPHLTRCQRIIATVVAVAGIVFLAIAAYALLAGTIKLGIAALLLGLPTLGIGYSILRKEDHRWPL